MENFRMQRGRSIEAKEVDNVMTGNREVKLEMSSYLQYFQMKIFRFKLQIDSGTGALL